MAFTHGLCREELIWFERQKSKDLRLKNTSGKVCRVQVTGGSMAMQEVVNEVDCLVPGNKQWEIESIAEGIFKVVLPTKADMARLKKLKRFQIENSDIVIHFS
jgi:hypothetical protein